MSEFEGRQDDAWDAGKWVITRDTIKVLVGEAFKEWMPKIIEQCKNHDIIVQAQCPGFQLFKNENDRRQYIELHQGFRLHIAFHERRERLLKWLIGLPYLGLATVLIKDFIFR